MQKALTLFILFSTFGVYAQDTTQVKHQTVILEVSGGQGLRFGKVVPSDLGPAGTQANELKSGLQFDVSLYVAIKPESNHYMGFKYNSFFKKAGTINSGVPTADLTLTFYGLGYMYVSPEARNAEWSLDGALGLMTYFNNSEYNQIQEVRGSTVGVMLGGAYYFRIAKNVYFGPKVGFAVGAIKKMKVTRGSRSENLTLDNPESMTRFDLSAGIRFKL